MQDLLMNPSEPEHSPTSGVLRVRVHVGFESTHPDNSLHVVSSHKAQ